MISCTMSLEHRSSLRRDRLHPMRRCKTSTNQVKAVCAHKVCRWPLAPGPKIPGHELCSPISLILSQAVFYSVNRLYASSSLGAVGKPENGHKDPGLSEYGFQKDSWFIAMNSCFVGRREALAGEIPGWLCPIGGFSPCGADTMVQRMGAGLKPLFQHLLAPTLVIS